MNKISYIPLLLVLVTNITPGCTRVLDETVYTDLGASNFYKTAADAESLLASVYGSCHGDESRTANFQLMGEATTDILLQRGGAINVVFRPAEDFVWDASHPRLNNMWDQHYRTIYRANVVMDHVPEIDMDPCRWSRPAKYP